MSLKDKKGREEKVPMFRSFADHKIEELGKGFEATHQLEDLKKNPPQEEKSAAVPTFCDDGSTPITDITHESWDRMMDIDLKSMFFVTQAVFEVMKTQHYGKMVHMSSLAALRGGRSSDASYACAKAGILNLSKCFALKGAEHHITSNAVCPGNILTPMGKTLSWSKVDPKTYIPAGRYGTAEDIANAVLFYASDLSDYVTGDYMNVNGGLYM